MQVIVNKDNYVVAYAIFGHLVDSIEVPEPENLNEDNYQFFKLENGELIYDASRAEYFELEKKRNYLRAQRKRICYPIVNRGQAWYDTLSNYQRLTLKSWYENWLVAPDTLEEPVAPDWIQEILDKEGIK